jgi:hypothetical protein
MSDDKVVRVSRLVPAEPQAIFDVLADPRRHADFDGSGSVKAARVNAPERLSLGAKFGMDMRIGLPYRITNEVVEFDEPRQIGWRHFGGHVWRYRLESTEGGTLVTEEFDWSTNKSPLMLKVMKAQERNRVAMEATLKRLEQMFRT